MVRRGFTIVELVIVIVVMGILMVLAVANLGGSQANARDKQREGNIGVIASNLEQFYSAGSGASIGRYPSTAMIGHETEYLTDLDPKVLIDPAELGETTSSLVAATNTTQSVTGITPLPSASNLKFIYQPLRTDGSLCTNETQECRKFNLYYYKETDSGSPVTIVRSRNQ